MGRFKVGDRVVLEGVVEATVDTTRPLKIRFKVGYQDTFYIWSHEGEHMTHVELVACGPEQLDAVTKERDEAREQLARVCAQVEVLSAELRSPRDAYKALLSLQEHTRKERDEAQAECVRLRAAEPTIEQWQASKRDRRILDCVETLLGLRRGER